MFRKFAVVATVVVAGFVAAPFAQAAVEVNLSTPKDAARTFGQGMSEGDIDAVKASAIANEEQQKALEALVAVVSNFKKVEEAAVAKFGEAGKTIANQQQMSIAEELKKIDESTEKIEGDAATLTPADSQDPLHLRNVDGQWKVDFAAMPGTEQVAEAVPMINAMANAADELAVEISADKYKTPEEAKNALGQKMMAAMMAAQMPTTQETEPAEDDMSGMDDGAVEEAPADDAAAEQAPPDDDAAEDAPAEGAVEETPASGL